MSEKARKSKPKISDEEQIDPIGDVIDKYTRFGWTCVVPPHGSVNDIIAQKNKKLHFIQVVDKRMIDNPKYSGEARNIFIQNAFSNMGVPVYAYWQIKSTRRGAPKINGKITFEDINLKTRIIIGHKKEAVGATNNL